MLLVLITIVLAATTILIYYKLNKNSQNLRAQNLIYEERVNNSLVRLQEQNQELQNLISENRQLNSFKGKYEHAENEINFLREEKNKILQESENLRRQILEFEKKNELLNQAVINLKNEQEQWHKSKEIILAQLSEELIKKNNEQQNQFSVFQQENVKKITEDLFKNFENISAKVMALNDEVKKSGEESSLIKNALLNPKSSGQFAEITLENILKNSGLKEKENLNSFGDYLLQSHFSGMSENQNYEGKRPDALLFFPNDQIVIIDSKSSPHFLELEIARQNSDKIAEKIILDKIKDSFKRHLESLCKKDYTKFLFEEMHNKNQSDCKILIVMFLQSESMLETIRQADATFEQKALERGIILATPIGLINFVSQARFVIDRIKQDKNIDNLKIAVRKLLDNMALLFKESKEVGRFLNKAINSHNKVVRNLNRGVYSSIKNISDLGIESSKSADLKMLEEYDEEGE